MCPSNAQPLESHPTPKSGACLLPCPAASRSIRVPSSALCPLVLVGPARFPRTPTGQLAEPWWELCQGILLLLSRASFSGHCSVAWLLYPAAVKGCLRHIVQACGHPWRGGSARCQVHQQSWKQNLPRAVLIDSLDVFENSKPKADAPGQVRRSSPQGARGTGGRVARAWLQEGIRQERGSPS